MHVEMGFWKARSALSWTIQGVPNSQAPISRRPTGAWSRRRRTRPRRGPAKRWWPSAPTTGTPSMLSSAARGMARMRQPTSPRTSSPGCLSRAPSPRRPHTGDASDPSSAAPAPISLVKVTIGNLTITDGLAPRGGGVLDEGAALTLHDDVLTKNQALGVKAGDPGQGGAVADTGAGASLTVRNSTFTANLARGAVGINGRPDSLRSG